MMRMKKLLCGALSALMLLSAALPGVSASAADSQPYAHAVKVIKALGLMDSENSVDFFENEPLTREDAVRYILKLKNTEISASGSQQYFKDVSPYDDNYALLSTAVRLGLVRGADSYFRPSDKVTGMEAVIMLMRAMGYDNQADPMGGTVAQYMSLALQYDFLKGVTDYNGEITRAAFAKLMYNTFDIGIVEQSSFGDNNTFTINRDKTSLSFLGLARETGIVTENSVSSIYDTAEPALAGNIIMEGKRFDVNGTNAASYLGYRAECYYLDEKGEEIPKIKYITDFENEEMTLDLSGGDLRTENGKLIFYDEESGKDRTLDINATTSILLNGKAIAYDLEVLANLPATGNILFVNNKDKNVTAKYGVVFVISEANDIVRSVDLENKYLYLENSLVNSSPYLDLSNDYNDMDISIVKDGKEIGFSDIAAGNVVTYAVSGDGKSVSIIVCDKTVKGEIQEFDNEKNGNLVLNGTRYPMSYDFYARDKVSAGRSATVYLNADGYAVDMDITLDKNYAYVAGVMAEEGIEDSVKIKVFTVSGSFSVMTLADKVTVYEGVSVPDTDTLTYHMEEISEKIPAKEVAEKLKSLSNDLIVYETNSKSEVTAIRFAIDIRQGNTITDSEGKKRTISINPEYYENMFTLNMYKTSSFQPNYGSIDGMGTTNMVTFAIPLDKTGKIVEKDCKAGVNMLSTDRNYSNVKFYDAGVKGVATVSLMQQGTSSDITSPNQPLCIMKRMATVIDKNGDTKDKIYYTKNGVEESAVISDEPVDAMWVKSKNIRELNFGDLFVYETNGQGELATYSVLFEPSKDMDIQKNLASKGNGVGDTREFQVLSGTMRYSGTDAVTLAMANSGVVSTFSLIGNKDVSAYKVNLGRETVSSIDIGGIREESFGSNAQPGQFVIARANRGVIQEVIVYE